MDSEAALNAYAKVNTGRLRSADVIAERGVVEFLHLALVAEAVA